MKRIGRAGFSRGVITQDPPAASREAAYEAFVATGGLRLRRVLVARYGPEVGVEVAADALAHAWERWDDVARMANPDGYLYRVAQSATRRHLRWRRRPNFPPEEPSSPGDPEPGLPAALAALPEAQRVAVLLVHAHGWSYEEAAEVLGVPVSTVRNHLHRGVAKLRRSLGVTDER